jgi:hypothetical protein
MIVFIQHEMEFVETSVSQPVTCTFNSSASFFIYCCQPGVSDIELHGHCTETLQLEIPSHKMPSSMQVPLWQRDKINKAKNHAYGIHVAFQSWKQGSYYSMKLKCKLRPCSLARM